MRAPALVRPTAQSCWRFCPALVEQAPPSTGTVVATRPQLSVGQPFDPEAAVLYGQSVQADYSMYDAAPNNLTPPPSTNFPAGYDLVTWVQMQDFIIGSTGPTFYFNGLGLTSWRVVNAFRSIRPWLSRGSRVVPKPARF